MDQSILIARKEKKIKEKKKTNIRKKERKKKEMIIYDIKRIRHKLICSNIIPSHHL